MPFARYTLLLVLLLTAFSPRAANGFEKTGNYSKSKSETFILQQALNSSEAARENELNAILLSLKLNECGLYDSKNGKNYKKFFHLILFSQQYTFAFYRQWYTITTQCRCLNKYPLYIVFENLII
jgi:hypothetical protein